MYHKERRPTLEKTLRRHSEDELMCRMKGSSKDALIQDKRQSVNEEIFKQLRIKAGAENMLAALSDHKDKRACKVLEMELSFVESNIQLLREQLARLNVPAQVKSLPGYIPMIAVGLKDTRNIDLRIPIMDFIMEHYGEDPQEYENSLESFLTMRKEAQNVYVSEDGISALLDYYNQLYYIEHRFFPADRNMGIFFEWYDSICGDPSAELSANFEKGCVLFNIAALWSQIAISQELDTAEGCKYAAHAFQSAAGCFNHLKVYYEGSPSCDLKPETLDFLLTLMLAQAQECSFELLRITQVNLSSLEADTMKSSESAEIAESYDVCAACLKCGDMWSYIPQSWRSLVTLKAAHYRSLSHFYVARCLDEISDTRIGDLEKHLSELYIINSECGTTADICALIVTVFGRKRLATIHLNADLKYRAEALRTQRTCKMLRKLEFLTEVMETYESSSRALLDQCQQDMYKFPNISVPSIKGHSIKKAFCIPPDFSTVETKDIFNNLGPISVFSAHSSWSSVRTVSLENKGNGFGFDVFGSMPVTVLKVTDDSPAAVAGLLPRDFIVGIKDKDIRWLKHCDAVHCIRDAGENIELKVITPQHTERLPLSHLHPTPGRRHMTSMFMETLAISPTSSISHISNNNNNNINSSTSSSTSSKKQRSSTLFLTDNANGALMKF